MAARRVPGEFRPAPFTPGARVTWTHVLPDGAAMVRRSGIVWSLAPVCHQGPTVWVMPDRPIGADPYPMVVVAQVRKGHRHVCGSMIAGRWVPASFREFDGGEAFSEAHELSQTGALAHGAAAWTRRQRRAAHDLAA